MKNSATKLLGLTISILVALILPASGQFTPADVGSPTVAGSTLTVAGAVGGFNVTGAGSDIGGTNDQFHFNYQAYPGDFDVKVRLEAISFVDAWSKAGLVAREDLTGGSRYAAAFATPNISGCFFQYRTFNNGQTTNGGSFPVTYPNTWLRLKRVGNTFTGFAGFDGASWMQLGSLTLTVPPSSPMLVGMAVTSRSTNQAATAQFRGFEDVTGTPEVKSLVFTKEPLGPSSRRTGLVISEIMYHPRTIGNLTNNSLEFIEIFNSQSIPENLTGYRLSGSIGYAFPSNTIINAGAFLVIARDPAFVQAHYGITGVLGPWFGVATNNPGISTNNLPGSEGLVRLRSKGDAVLLQVPYEGRNPWPIAADGSGHSLVLARPSYGEGDPKAWAASDSIDGSPGRAEPFNSDALSAVVINEFLAHTDEPQEDFIELYNRSLATVDLSGAYLTDEASTNKFRIPNGTFLAPTSHVAFAQTTLGFALSSKGERIFLVNSNTSRVIDSVDFDGQANGVSSGRFPDGAPTFSVLFSTTPGARNSGVKISDIVINEIMYNPVTGNDDDEFVELFNRTASPVDIGGWRLQGGVAYTIPAGAVIPAYGYVVIANSVTNLLARYANLNATNTFGNYGGNLGNGGERIALAFPDYSFTTNANTLVITTNVDYVTVNELAYGDGGRWGEWSDGGGSSLELIDAEADNRQPANWADSDETAKSSWTSFEVTGNMGQVLGTANMLLVYQLGVGECLVDDVEVVVNGANLVTNPSFESGLTGWSIFAGSHDHSTIENIGFSGTRSLHIRAGSRGDDSANSIRSSALAGLGLNNITLRAKARWLRGFPEVLLRLRGGGLEVTGRLPLPVTLGSPGARNGRALSNAGPAIFDVAHTPVLPAAGEPIVVTARASDSDGVASMAVRYRVDSTVTPITRAMFAPVMMIDDGTGGDAIAGDGVFSATIPGQASGTAIGFYIEAADNGPASGRVEATNTFPQFLFPAAGLTRCFPYDTFSRELVVRWGDRQMLGSFATYHLWVTLATAGRWNDRHEICNTPLDGTFAYNNYRVFYNCRPQFAGSPWHAGAMAGGPTNNALRMDYVCNFPEDDRFLGATDTVLNTIGNPDANRGTDSSGQAEQTSYIIFREMGIQYNYRRYFHFFLNGNQRSVSDKVPGGLAANSLMEDSQQPNTDVIEQWFPDDTDGELYKIEDWFAFSDTGFNAGNNDADLGRRTNTINGQIVVNPAPYRFMWRKRAVSAGESASDYRTFYKLLDAVSPTPIYTSTTNLPIAAPDELDAIADIEQWMRIIAVQHAIGNWDAYGYERGKNAFTYKPQNGRFTLWTWDIDFTMGIGGHGPTTDLFAQGADGDRRIRGMWNTPVFLRMYWRAFQDMVDGVWNRSFLDPILDAKAQAFTQNNISYAATGGDSLQTIKDFITARHTYMVNQLATVASRFAITGTNYIDTTDNWLTLTGTAPITAKEIWLNGAAYPVTWTSVTGWTARVHLATGTNDLTLQPHPPGTNPPIALTAVYPGTPPSPAGHIHFNELLYDPATPEAAFVELHNTHPTFTFDLSGWRVNGLDYTFPLGSYITNGQHLVLAKSRAAVLNQWPNATVFDLFPGNLDRDGETLTLLQPGTGGQPDHAIDKIRYEARLPWAPLAHTGGPSLQLLDPTVDNSRSSAWAAGGVWSQVTRTGNIGTATNLLLWITTPGNCYVDDITLVPTAEGGTNIVLNGDFESDLTGPWILPPIYATSTITNGLSHSGNASLFLHGTAGGSGLNVLQQWIGPRVVPNTTYTLTYWLLLHTNTVLSNMRTLPGNNLTLSAASRALVASPGEANHLNAPLPAYDPIWLNELAPDNLAGILDNFGQREPWLELYNAGATPVDLSAYYLADNYEANLTRWKFPAGASLAPGEHRLIWADGQPEQTTATELHTNFRLDPMGGSVALVRLVDGQPQITDYLTYTGVGSDQTYGDYPDGQPFTRLVLREPTPRGTNTARFIPVFINEWLAGNTNNLADPADGQFEDWIELYNAGTNAVDLGGYLLTDNPGGNTNNYYRIPSNGQYTIPAGGYLLVWADNEANQNSAVRIDLHANFALAKGGESIALYAPDARTLVDRVDFGQQTDDIAGGRYPDGTPNIADLILPTPRSANQLPGANTAPQLAAIANRTVRFGQPVHFTATATDFDQPPQLLAFALDSGAPAGATIDSGSGVFHWLPFSDQTPSTNVITIRVTDNGAPTLSATRNFTVIVLLPPKAAIARDGSSISLAFDTIPGRTYQAQYKHNLADEFWVNLPIPSMVASGSTAAINDIITTLQQRFYRIVQLD